MNKYNQAYKVQTSAEKNQLIAFKFTMINYELCFIFRLKFAWLNNFLMIQSDESSVYTNGKYCFFNGIFFYKYSNDEGAFWYIKALLRIKTIQFNIFLITVLVH